MADYLYIENYSKKGKIGISLNTFDSLVSQALENVPGISKSQKKLSKNQNMRLNRPVQTSITRGILHVAVYIDVLKGTDIQAVTKSIHEKINEVMETATETVPYDVQVKVMSLF